MSDEQQFDGKKYAEDLRERIHQSIDTGMNRTAHRAPVAHGVVPGIILILIGAIFLLDHMGIVHVDSLWRFWPMILILVGLSKLTRAGEQVLGIGFIIVGALLQLHELNHFGLSWGAIWPLILIFVGLSLIWNRYESRQLFLKGAGNVGPGSIASGGDVRNTVNEYAMFGGAERKIKVSDFRGGNVTAIFGGVNLDFRDADIEGEEAVLFVEALFGGIDIKVPNRWNIAFQVQSVFAGYSDETRPPVPDPTGAVPKKTLIIHGRATFGGITVKN